MGEQQNQPLQLSFNPSWTGDFQGSRVISDSGLLPAFELESKNMQLGLPDVLRQSVHGWRTGYED